MNNKNIYFIKFFVFSVLFVFVSVCFMLVSTFMTRSSTDVFSPSDDFYIIIDAGHGGEDGGALSDSGIVEKDLNLDIALKLEKLLALSDYNCLLTRNSDRLMYDAGQENHKKASDITNRIKISNAYTNSIFISIHQNKFPIKKYSGLQVYYSKNHENSAVLGNLIQQNTKYLLQRENNRQIKKADKNIRILDSIKTPAVLVECGFLSNDREAELLNDEGYRNKIVYLLYCSIIQYLDEKGMEIQIEK